MAFWYPGLNGHQNTKLPITPSGVMRALSPSVLLQAEPRRRCARREVADSRRLRKKMAAMTTMCMGCHESEFGWRGSAWRNSAEMADRWMAEFRLAGFRHDGLTMDSGAPPGGIPPRWPIGGWRSSAWRNSAEMAGRWMAEFRLAGCRRDGLSMAEFRRGSIADR